MSGLDPQERLWPQRQCSRVGSVLELSWGWYFRKFRQRLGSRNTWAFMMSCQLQTLLFDQGCNSWSTGRSLHGPEFCGTQIEAIQKLHAVPCVLGDSWTTHVSTTDVSPHEPPEIPAQTEELASQRHLPQSFAAFQNPAYHDMTIESIQVGSISKTCLIAWMPQRHPSKVQLKVATACAAIGKLHGNGSKSKRKRNIQAGDIICQSLSTFHYHSWPVHLPCSACSKDFGFFHVNQWLVIVTLVKEPSLVGYESCIVHAQEVAKKRLVKKPIQENYARIDVRQGVQAIVLWIFSQAIWLLLLSLATGLRLQLEVLERKDVKVEAPRTTPFTLLSCVESTGQDALVLAANIQETPKKSLSAVILWTKSCNLGVKMFTLNFRDRCWQLWQLFQLLPLKLLRKLVAGLRDERVIVCGLRTDRCSDNLWCSPTYMVKHW